MELIFMIVSTSNNPIGIGANEYLNVSVVQNMIGLAIKRLQKLSWQSLNLLNELASSYGDETILLEDRIMHLIKLLFVLII